MIKKFMILTVILFSTASLADEGRVQIVTTIRPIYAIIAAITKDRADVDFVVDEHESMHDFSLTAQEIEIFRGADAIILVSRNFENFMVKPLEHKSKKTEVLELAKIPNLKLLELRENNIIATNHDHSHEDENADEHDHEHVHLDHLDYHIWLSPDNAKLMAENILKTLVKIDPHNSDFYAKNKNEFFQKLQTMDLEIKKKINHRQDPYLVFHDAYQYFDRYYGLNYYGSIMMDEQAMPSAKRISALRKAVIENKIQCVFSEPQFPSRIVEYLRKETGINSGVLDPEWGDSHSKPEDAYVDLIKKLAENFDICFSQRQ